MIVSLGDLHFRADYPWFRNSAESFLEWFETWTLNNSNNTLILLGDIVDKSINGGIVIDYIERLVNSSNFLEIYIVAGNHDFKRVNGVYQLAYDFLNRRNNVHIIREMVDIEIEDMTCLFLPHLVPTVKIPAPSKYYSDLYKSRKTKADIVFGHIQDKSFPGESVANLDKLANHICLGHIHVRVNSSYLGSVFPQNYSENGERICRIYKASGKRVAIDVQDEVLPTFLDFKTIEYGGDVVKDNALNSVYVIHNCPPDHLLDSKYDNIYIRKKYKAPVKKADVKKSSGKKTTKEYFNAFLKQSNSVYNRTSIKICREALSV